MGSVFAHYCKTKSPLWSGHTGWPITETVSRGYKRLFLSSMSLRIGESPYAGPSSPHVTAVKFPTLSPTPPDQSAKYKGSLTSIYFLLLTLYLFISLCALKNIAWHFEKKTRQGQPIHLERNHLQWREGSPSPWLSVIPLQLHSVILYGAWLLPEPLPASYRGWLTANSSPVAEGQQRRKSSGLIKSGYSFPHPSIG